MARESATKTATMFALASATLMIAQQVAGKATRDAVFLSQYDVTDLPKMVISAAILSMVAVIMMSRLLVAYGPSRVIPIAFGFSTILFLGNWWLYASMPQNVAILLYLQMSIFGAVLISGFWSVVNERFDPHTAKHTIARVAAAATLGGVLGGLLAGRVAEALDIRSMLLVLGALHFVCFLTVRAIGDGRRGAPISAKPTMQSGLQLLATNRYLQLMAVLMVLVAVMAALVDYAFKSAASARFSSGEELVSFFGQFYAAVGVLTFLVQSALGPRVLKRYGIGITLAVMPAVTFGAGLLSIVLSAKLWSIVALRAGQVAFTNSFSRSAFELLYTPLPPLTKRPTKTIIDVASDRLGDVVGSGVLLLLLAITPILSTQVVISLAIVGALLTLAIVRLLYRGYVEQLASSLRDGDISLNDDEVIDATTRHTLAEASSASERALLMEKIREMKRERGSAEPPTLDDGPQPLLTEQHADDSETTLSMSRAVSDLTSGDIARVRRCLAGEALDIRLVAYLIPLLGMDEIAEDIRMELRWKAPQTIGTLTDALLDPDLSLVARQRIPSILEVTHNPRAVNALLAALHDEEFNVRYSCGRALARMNERDSHMRINADEVFAAVEREVSVDHGDWTSRDLDVDLATPADMTSATLPGDPRIDYSLEHVFTLLSLTLDRDALLLSRQAIMSSDRNLRGTALEYLENVLPEAVRKGLWPYLGEPAPKTSNRRGPGEIVAELKRETPND